MRDFAYAKSVLACTAADCRKVGNTAGAESCERALALIELHAAFTPIEDADHAADGARSSH